MPKFKKGALVKAGWSAVSAEALIDKSFNSVMMWEEASLGTMASCSIPYGERGIIVDVRNSMVRVQWSSSIGWVYDEAVKLIQE